MSKNAITACGSDAKVENILHELDKYDLDRYKNTDRLWKGRKGGHIQGLWIDELHLVFAAKTREKEKTNKCTWYLLKEDEKERQNEITSNHYFCKISTQELIAQRCAKIRPPSFLDTLQR